MYDIYMHSVSLMSNEKHCNQWDLIHWLVIHTGVAYIDPALKEFDV